MKTKFTLLCLMLIAFFFTKAQTPNQVPNGNFDNWGAYAPVGWATYGTISDGVLSYFALKDTLPADVVPPSTASVKLISDSVVISPSDGVIGSVLSLGGGTLTSDSTPPRLYRYSIRL